MCGVLIFKLGPLLLCYNEGVDDLVNCERMRKLDGNILPCIPSFKMVLIDNCPAFQMVLTDVHHYIFSRWVCIRIIRSEGAIWKLIESEAAKNKETHDQAKSNSRSSLPRLGRLALRGRLNVREVERDEDGNSCDKWYKKHQGEERSLHQLRPVRSCVIFILERDKDKERYRDRDTFLVRLWAGTSTSGTTCPSWRTCTAPGREGSRTP